MSKTAPQTADAKAPAAGSAASTPSTAGNVPAAAKAPAPAGNAAASTAGNAAPAPAAGSAAPAPVNAGGSTLIAATAAKTPAAKPAPAVPTGKAAVVMLVIMMTSNLLASFNQSLMNIALDNVAATYRITLSQANWTVLAFTIVAATTITMAASLLKRFGTRKVMFSGYALSLVGSLLGLFAVNFPMVIVARIVQAFTVGLFFPTVTSVILALAPKDKSATYLAVNSGVIGIGLALTPLVSGWLLTAFGFHALFVVPVIGSVALIAVGIPLLHDVFPRQDKAVDPLSVCLSFVGMALFIYGLNEVTKTPVLSTVLIVAGIAVLAIFAKRQFSLKDPLLNLRPFTHVHFAAGEVIMMVGYMGSIFLSLLLPLYLEGSQGMTASKAGVLLCLPILAYAAFCFIGGRIEDKHGIWPLVPVGFLLMTAAYVGLGLTSDNGLVVPMLVCAAAGYAGVGLVFPTLKASDLASLPDSVHAAGASIHSTLVQIATSIGSALFVGIMSGDVDRLTAAGTAKAAAYA